MGSISFVLAAISVVLFCLGLWVGRRWSKSACDAELASQRASSEIQLVSQRDVAEAREKGLRENLEDRESELQTLRPKAEELAATRQQLLNEQEKYAQMKQDLEQTFRSAAATALAANNESFLTLAKLELGGQARTASNDLAAKELAIKNMLDPVGAALRSLDEQARQMETQRSGAYSKLETLVENIQKTIPVSLDALKVETAQLITALRAPKTRGNWGELQLKRCVEFAGMVQYCSFSAQVSRRDEEDKMLRPDMVIQLPNGREIVVDAKTPLDAFLEGTGNAEATSQALRFAAHAQRVKAHLRDLSGKAYWRQFEKAPDFVICFLPSEALFSAALEADPGLIEFSVRNNVVMATPTTLIALLRAVEFGWQQMEITKNAQAIKDAGCKIYEKLVVAQGHLLRLGNTLSNGVEHYNRFIGTIEGKGGIFSVGRKLGELSHSDAELVEAMKLTPEVRQMESDEWSQTLLTVAAGNTESSVGEL